MSDDLLKEFELPRTENDFPLAQAEKTNSEISELSKPSQAGRSSSMICCLVSSNPDLFLFLQRLDALEKRRMVIVESGVDFRNLNLAQILLVQLYKRAD